jgi:hypothetical protein
MAKKYCLFGFAALGTALFNTGFYQIHNIHKPLQKDSGIEAVKHMTAFFFAIKDTHFLHQIQVSGYNRSVLGHIFSDCPYIGSLVQQKEADDLNPDRLSNGFKKL